MNAMEADIHITMLHYKQNSRVPYNSFSIARLWHAAIEPKLYHEDGN